MLGQTPSPTDGGTTATNAILVSNRYVSTYPECLTEMCHAQCFCRSCHLHRQRNESTSVFSIVRAFQCPRRLTQTPELNETRVCCGDVVYPYSRISNYDSPPKVECSGPCDGASSCMTYGEPDDMTRPPSACQSRMLCTRPLRPP